MKRFLIIIPLFITLISLWSCNEDTLLEPKKYGSVRGQVLYDKTRLPAGKVIVRLTPGGKTVETDSLTGYFRMDSIVIGKYTIQTQKEGYTPQFTTVETDPDVVANLTIFLVEDKVSNRPPVFSDRFVPVTGEDSVKTTTTLRWKATDPNRDSLRYDVLLFQNGISDPITLVSDYRYDSLVVKNLKYGATYYWQVIAKDDYNTTKSQVLSFQTLPFPSFSYVYARRISGQYQLFISNGSGEEIQLTTVGSNWRPIVSPNGKQIAFISNADTDQHLYLMNINGSGIQKVTTVPLGGNASIGDLSFCWSPDGTQLLYPSNDKLYVVRTDGTGLRVVKKAPSGRFFTGCDWSGVNNLIVARTTASNGYDSQFIFLSPDGSNERTVLQRTNERTGNPVFSIRGNLLLFSQDITGFQNEEGRQLDARIFYLEIATGSVSEITSSGGSGNNNSKPPGTNDLDPRFSPDGFKIIFTNVSNTGNGERKVFVMDVNGQNRTQLLTNSEMAFWR